MPAPAVGFGDPELKRLANELIGKCADLFAHRFGLDTRQAQREAKKLVKQARKTLNGQPLLHEPPRRGQRRLERWRKLPEGQRRLKALREDGVRDPDFIQWWDLHILEQEVICAVDGFEQAQLLERLTAHKLTLSEAQEHLRLQRPLFGRTQQSAQTFGPHVPLPYEMRTRVLTYLSNANSTDLQEGAKRCMSLNAYLRERIRSGDL